MKAFTLLLFLKLSLSAPLDEKTYFLDESISTSLQLDQENKDNDYLTTITFESPERTSTMSIAQKMKEHTTLYTFAYQAYITKLVIGIKGNCTAVPNVRVDFSSNQHVASFSRTLQCMPDTNKPGSSVFTDENSVRAKYMWLVVSSDNITTNDLDLVQYVDAHTRFYGLKVYPFIQKDVPENAAKITFKQPLLLRRIAFKGFALNFEETNLEALVILETGEKIQAEALPILKKSDKEFVILFGGDLDVKSIELQSTSLQGKEMEYFQTAPAQRVKIAAADGYTPVPEDGHLKFEKKKVAYIRAFVKEGDVYKPIPSETVKRPAFFLQIENSLEEVQAVYLGQNVDLQVHREIKGIKVKSPAGVQLYLKIFAEHEYSVNYYSDCYVEHFKKYYVSKKLFVEGEDVIAACKDFSEVKTLQCRLGKLYENTNVYFKPSFDFDTGCDPKV